MTELLQILCLILLSTVVYQDFKYRAVHAWIFPVLAGVVLFADANSIVSTYIAINTGIILVQLFMLTLYFSIKQKKFVNITNHYLGWGDVLFLLILCLVFSPLNFILFYVFTLLMTLLFSALFSTLKKGRSNIPLAGIQAFFLIVCLLLSSIANWNLKNDDAILYYLVL